MGKYSTVYDLHGSELHLTTHPDHVASVLAVLRWQVTDITAAAQGLIAKGVSPIIYADDHQADLGIWLGVDGEKMAWFADPDGNILTLSEG